MVKNLNIFAVHFGVIRNDSFFIWREAGAGDRVIAQESRCLFPDSRVNLPGAVLSEEFLFDWVVGREDHEANDADEANEADSETSFFIEKQKNAEAGRNPDQTSCWFCKNYCKNWARNKQERGEEL